MEMIETPASSNIHSVGYEPDEEILAIRFRRSAGPGALYHYKDVPLSTYESLLSAPSTGKYFNSYVKSVFDSRQIED